MKKNTKKKKIEISEDIKREFGVILEDISDKFQLVAEGHSELNNKINRIEINIKDTKDETVLIRFEISDIKSEIKAIRAVLYNKADLERIEKLEKRVVYLETKVASLRRSA